MASPATLEDIPRDVLSHIFIRLLSKQLAQMRCVSKSWNTLLSHSSFVKSHLHFSTHNNHRVILVSYEGHYSSFDIKAFTLHPSPSSELELTNFIKLPVNPQSELTRGSVIGSVNGLICIAYKTNSNHVVYIWNPSLSAMLTLPPYTVTVTSPNVCRVSIHFRFGFDPKTDDYKVVKLSSFYQCTIENTGYTSESDGTEDPKKEWLQVEVYSMRKGLWELITHRFPSYITSIKEQTYEVCVDGQDGYLHWLCDTDLDWKPQTIVAFDLGAETFREILLPDSVLNQIEYYALSLGVLAGKICVVVHGKWHYWVLADSWVKHHLFPQISGYIYPIGFTLQNEFLFDVAIPFSSERYLGFCDSFASKAKTFNVFSPSHGWNKFVKYVDSLVWLAPAEHKISCCSTS